MKKYLAFFVSVSLLTAPSAFANNETAGTIIGGILGGIIGGQTGNRGKDNAGRVIVGGLIGGLIGNRIGADMDDKDRDAYDRTSRDCFNGPVGRDLNWQGNRYHGNVRSTREGYYMDANGRQVCREFHSEIYRDQSVESVDGVVCNGPNGWQKVESRDVRFDNDGFGMGRDDRREDRRDDGRRGDGRIGDGRGQSNVQYDLGVLGPISRRTGGGYLSLNLMGRNLRSISLQSSGDKVRIYRVMATTNTGMQMQLNSALINTFLFMGNSADFDLSMIPGSVARLDILVEAWDNNLSLFVKGQGASLQPPVVIQRPPMPPPVVVRPEPIRPPQYQVRVCDAVARQNAYNGSQCVQSLAGKYLDPEADRVCASMAVSPSDAYNTSQCASYAAGARFSASGLRVCEAVGQGNSYNGAECVKSIANKMIDERFVQGCITTARNNAYNGKTCVENLVIGNY